MWTPPRYIFKKALFVIFLDPLIGYLLFLILCSCSDFLHFVATIYFVSTKTIKFVKYFTDTTVSRDRARSHLPQS